MPATKEELFTAGKLAEKLGLSGSQVKKAIEDLSLKPAAVKGACKYYGKDALAKVKAVLK
jgi:predicted ArsR family transcriptional regulator